MMVIWWMYSKTEDTQVSAMREKEEHFVLVIARFCTCNTVQSVTAFCGNSQKAVKLLLHSTPSLWRKHNASISLHQTHELTPSSVYSFSITHQPIES